MTRHLKQVIADNIRTLLRLPPSGRGSKGVGVLINMGIANGNVQRIYGAETSIGTDLIDQVTDALRRKYPSLEPWQLCVPGVDPDRLPALGNPAGFRWPFKAIDPEVITSLVGTAAQSVENGLLVVLSTLNVSPRKTGREVLPPAPPALEPDAARVAAIYSRIASAENKRIARALLEQFAISPGQRSSAEDPLVLEPIPDPSGRPAKQPARRLAARRERRGL